MAPDVRLEMVQAAAWGAANERKFGAANLDAQQAGVFGPRLRAERVSQAWDRFARHVQLLATRAELSDSVTNDLKWYVFNACWMMVNLRWYGANSADHLDAAERAQQHFRQLGGVDSVLLRRPKRGAPGRRRKCGWSSMRRALPWWSRAPRPGWPRRC